MTYLDFVKAFYERSHSRDSIVSEIDSVLGSRPREIKVTAIPFSTARTPSAEFARQVSKTRTIKLIKESEGVCLFELTYTFKDGKHKRRDAGNFYVYEHPIYPNVFVAITIENASFVRRGLLPFLHARFPHIIVGFLPQARLNRLLGDFRSAYNFSELIITRATQRLRLPDEGTHRRVMPVMSWPEMALDEAIDWLVEHNGWFQSVQFEAKRDGKTITQISITREGLVKCDYLFERVWNSFVLPVCKMHNANFNLFSKRGRRENSELAVRPLVIKFDDRRFDDVEENKKFIHAMRSMRAASVSVLHGNPYIHLGMIDYLDGSAFDVWVLDSQEIIIVPQMHGSVGSIKRLVNHVFDTYSEGEVADFLAGGDMTENEWRNKIDDYNTSIQAIVGFANFYVWNPATRADREGVVVFQGRRLTKKKDVKEEANRDRTAADDQPGEPPKPDVSARSEGDVAQASGPVHNIVQSEGKSTLGAEPGETVTPDLGIVTGEGHGVLAEVKISFPRDEEHWFEDFAQLMSYDAELEGWPTASGKVVAHDVVLIAEQGRANKVKKFFEKHLGDTIQFHRPFVIVSCNRADNREQYYFFQRIVGKLSSKAVDEQLDDGTKVPMKVLVGKYSTVKIYDAEPPLPCMMDLIWSQVVLEAARQEPKFPKLRKRQKLPIILDVDEIVQKLREGFTFRSIAANALDGSPSIPHTHWVKKALEQMVASKDAEWIDSKRTIRVFFQRYEDSQEHFINACLRPIEGSAPSSDTQLTLPLSG